MGQYNFEKQLAISKGLASEREKIAIMQMIPGCIEVLTTTIQEDKTGIDYFAVLRGGRKIAIDAKRREKGCSKWWKNGPELALETYSVMPTKGNAAKTGWTLDESKKTELVLFSYDINDTNICFLESFQILRTAFRKYCKKWKGLYKVDRQRTIDERGNVLWESECVFVPYLIVQTAIQGIKQAKIIEVETKDNIQLSLNLQTAS